MSQKCAFTFYFQNVCSLSDTETAQKVTLSMHVSAESPYHTRTPKFYLQFQNEYPRNWVDFTVIHTRTSIPSAACFSLENNFHYEILTPENNTYQVRRILPQKGNIVLVQVTPMKHHVHEIQLQMDTVLKSHSTWILGDRVSKVYWGTTLIHKPTNTLQGKRKAAHQRVTSQN